MVAVTSGTYTFSMDIDEIIEDAFEPLGGEHISGDDARKARRALNRLLIKLRNKNIPLSKIGTETINLVANTTSYDLPVGVTAVLEVNYYDSTKQVETGMEPMGVREFHEIPNKAATGGRPVVYCVENLRDQFKIKVWQPPATTGNSLKLLVAYKIEDITASYQKLDLNSKYYPLIVDWLSYELSLTRQGIDPNLRAELKAKYDECLMDVFEEDRERGYVNCSLRC